MHDLLAEHARDEFRKHLKCLGKLHYEQRTGSDESKNKKATHKLDVDNKLKPKLTEEVHAARRAVKNYFVTAHKLNEIGSLSDESVRIIYDLRSRDLLHLVVAPLEVDLNDEADKEDLGRINEICKRYRRRYEVLYTPQ